MTSAFERTLRAAALGCLIIAVGACAASPPRVPPLEPSGARPVQPGQFVWFDLLTAEVDAVQTFYGELLGWSFRAGPDEAYTTILHEGRPIGGIAHLPDLEERVNSAQWISNLSVDDVDAAVERVRRAGGEVVSEPSDVPDRGRLALVRDDQGALVALVRSSTGDPAVDRSQVGAWLWVEHWTRDARSTGDFYRSLVGYEMSEVPDRAPGTYYVFERDGIVHGGALEFDFQGVQPNWLPYLLVEDVEAVVARVEQLGGRVLIPPRPEIREGTAAVIADPSGAAVSLQEFDTAGAGGEG